MRNSKLVDTISWEIYLATAHGEMQHEKITQELVDATIDTVYVYDKKRIEVVFKFDDILMRAIEKYQKGEKEA